MIGKALKGIKRPAPRVPSKPAPRTPAMPMVPAKMPTTGGFGAGFGGGARMARPATDLSRLASAAKTPAASVLRSGKPTPLSNVARSMMKKGGAVKKTTAKKTAAKKGKK